MRVRVSGEVVQVDLREPKADKHGEIRQWWDAYLRSEDPRLAADRISGQHAAGSECPRLGDTVEIVADVTARSGNYGTYLSAVARSVRVLRPDDDTVDRLADAPF